MLSYPCIAWFHAWRSNWGACAHAVRGIANAWYNRLALQTLAGSAAYLRNARMPPIVASTNSIGYDAEICGTGSETDPNCGAI